MPIGLTIRMAGENPVANEAQGINVLLIRTGAVMAGSALMAIGGAFLKLFEVVFLKDIGVHCIFVCICKKCTFNIMYIHVIDYECHVYW